MTPDDNDVIQHILAKLLGLDLKEAIAFYSNSSIKMLEKTGDNGDSIPIDQKSTVGNFHPLPKPITTWVNSNLNPRLERDLQHVRSGGGCMVERSLQVYRGASL